MNNCVVIPSQDVSISNPCTIIIHDTLMWEAGFCTIVTVTTGSQFKDA